jgi:hypothetical protein
MADASHHYSLLADGSLGVLVDRPSAPELLALLTAVAGLTAHELSLGLDIYRDPERLSDRISTHLASPSAISA